MTKRFFTFILFITCINYLFGQSPLIKNYTVSDGLSTNTIYYSFQDRDHFIWFATDDGVVRFDGKNFQRFNTDDGLENNEIIRIKQDKSGRIWFFNLFGTANYYYQNKLYSNKNSELLKKIELPFFVRDFFEDEDSTLYLYDSRHNFCIIYPNQDVLKIRLDYENVNLADLLLLNKTEDGEFLLWTTNGLLELDNFQTDPKQIKGIQTSRAFPNKKHECIFYNNSEELIRYKDTKIQEIINVHLGTLVVNSILVAKNGIIWISALNKGVFCIKDKVIFDHIDIEQAQSIVEDIDGNIWITSMSNGVYKIHSDFNQIKFYGNANFQDKNISILSKSQNEGMWATNGSSIFLLQNNIIFKNANYLTFSNIDFIKQLKNKSFIAAYLNEGINLYSNLILDTKKSEVSFASVVKRKDEFGKEIIINNAENKLACRSSFQINKYDLFPEIKKLFSLDMGTRVNSAYFNIDDDLVVNADKNYVINNDSIFEYELLESFNGKIITSHIILNDSVEVISVEGRKLYLILNQQKIFDLTSYAQIELKNKMKDFAYDGVRLFFSTFYDIHYIENPCEIIRDGRVHLSSLNINFKEIYDIECSGDNLYVASSEGITIVPQKQYLNEPNLNLTSYIQFVQVDGEKVDFTSGIINISGDSKIEIKFSSINYSSFIPEYLYMLEGYEYNWFKSDGNTVSYQNLESGKYIFYLKSKINGDYFSLPKELIINVEPTLFQRLYFWAFMTIIASLFVSILFYFRKNKLSKRNSDEISLLNLESKALRSMMNPHFIFNSLGSIQNYILHNKPNEAGLYLSQFARLIRQNMNSLNSNFISVEDEVDKLRNYLDLERLRLNNSFDYNIDIDPRIEPDEIFIPTMMIQLFVENAIWHGISQIETRGEINVRFSMVGKKQVSVFIEDNGIGITKSMESVKIDSHLNLGIDLTKKRLKLLGKRYNVRTKLIISELYPGQSNPGTKIDLIFPTTFSNS